MKIRIRKGNIREPYWCSWNNAGYDSYDVIDNNGKLIANFDTREEADSYIRDNTYTSNRHESF